MPATEAKTAAKMTILAARKQPIARPDVEDCAVYSPTGNAPITKANLVEIPARVVARQPAAGPLGPRRPRLAG